LDPNLIKKYHAINIQGARRNFEHQSILEKLLQVVLLMYFLECSFSNSARQYNITNRNQQPTDELLGFSY